MADKTALARLKERRGPVSKELLDRVKESSRMKRDILGVLRKPMTIPEISQVTGIASDIVMWHTMTMRRYGKVTDAGKKGDYVLYTISKGE